ncbi:hypothetical protein [Maritalea sp.]|jgi:hypothetical protein|uniref:head-tail joining protein n=1 Tax=Maritalea sp. TaxID=2003361 RepID=UPI0039E3D158
MTLAQTLRSDLPIFFDVDEFATAFTYQLSTGGTTYNLAGNFDNATLQVDDLGPVPVSVGDATITCAASTLPSGYGEADLIGINAKNYKVAAPVDVDGQGMARLYLELVE